MSKQYLVTTPRNPSFNGKTCGVMFRGGRAFVSEHTIDQSLGWSLDEVIRRMKEDFGYEVEVVGGATLDLFDEETVNITPTKSASKKRIEANA
jgi:hypothetical protein